VADDEPLELWEPTSADDLMLADVHVPVICSLCTTRMLAARSQVGTRIVCPDCGTATVVPPPASKRTRAVPVDDGEPLEVCAPIERAPVQVSGYDPEPDRAWPGDRRDDDDSRRAEARRNHRPPRFTFFSGIYRFPFHAGLWQRWVVLSLVLAIIVILFSAVVSLGSNRSPLVWLGSPVLGILAFFIGLAWSVTVSVNSLAIVQDTAEGNDDINWPNAAWIDWIQDSFYVFNALFLSALAGLGVAWLLRLVERPYDMSGPVTVFLLFPLVLLSMLEAASPTTPVSRRVLRCLVIGWQGWVIVYLQTGVLVAVTGWIAWQLVSVGGLIAAAAVSPLLVAVLMIYFRLWGRLAWHCARKFALEAEAEDDADDAEDAED
jgi:hypothetical protein